MSESAALGARPSRFERHRHRVLALFAERGFGQVSLRQVATELELTVGSLYHHCEGKQGLLFEFIEEHYQALLLLFVRRTGRPAGTSLATVIDLLHTLYARSPAHFHLALHERQNLTGEHLRSIEQLRAQVGQQLARLLLSSLGCQRHTVLIEPALAVFEQLPLWRSTQCQHTHRLLGERLLAATVITLPPEKCHADVPRALT